MVRGVSRFGTLCGVLAILTFTTGCPGLFGPCANFDANDDNLCTDDSCEEVAGVATAVNTPVDCADQVCNPADGECVDCVAAADCADDGDICTAEACGADNTCSSSAIAGCCATAADCDDSDLCTDDACVDNNCTNVTTVCDDGDACTDDSCDSATGCTTSPVACAIGEVCVDGNCLTACVAGDLCDDSNLCTTDTCDTVAGACSNVAVDCDDSVTCTDDSCDSTTGACVNANNCAAGEACDTTTGLCSPGTACTVATEATDCPDNGDFCDGAESCDATTLFCVHAGTPCTALQTCNESLNTCVNPPGTTINFTLGTDISPATDGTAGDDTYSAALLFNAPTGTNVPSLQTGDNANGGDGTDSVDAQFNFSVAATTVAPTLTNIETINITDYGTQATTLAGASITGATAFNFSNSANTANVFTVTSLPTLANVGVTNQAVGATLSFATAATSGATDAMTLTLNGMTAGTLTFTSGTTNGVETLNIVSSTAASTVADIVMNGTTLTTVNVSGDANFTHTASLDANVTTVNASTATGNVSVRQDNAGAFTFTGGAGNDSVNLAGNYGTTDTINGGAGSDTLRGLTAVIGGTAANQTNVTNTEKLRVSDAHTTAINVTHFGSITDVTLDLGSNAGTITNAASGLKVNQGVSGAGGAVGAGTLIVTVSGSATTDSVTYTLSDAEQAGAVTFTGVETLNLVSNLNLDGSAAAVGTAGQNTLTSTLILTDTAALEKVVVTGTEQLNLTGAVTANQIDASAFTEPLIMGAACTISGVTVTGGSGADTLWGSAGNDILIGGAGNDIINSLAGNDIVTGGAGANTFRQSIAGLLGVDRQTITDFDDTVTSGDVFNLNSGLATLTGTDNFATSATIQTHSASGNLAVNAAAEVVVIRSATVTDLTSANSLTGTNLVTAVGGTITGAIVGQNNILLIVADTSGNVGVYYATSADNAIIAAEITLVAVLQGADVAIANLVFNNFSNGA
jgi:hypothetical protein